MKTFKEFLKEDWDEVLGRSAIVHRSVIHGHKIRLNFFAKDSATQHYNAHYSINDSSTATNVQSHEVEPILKHVRNKIHEFIEKYEPLTLSFNSPNDTKRALHRKLSQHLAKKYNGQVLHVSDDKRYDDTVLFSSPIKAPNE